MGQRGTGEVGPEGAVREEGKCQDNVSGGFNKSTTREKRRNWREKLRLKENQFMNSGSWFESTVNKMLQQAGKLATKSDNPKFSPQDHRVEEEEESLRATFRPVRV